LIRLIEVIVLVLIAFISDIKTFKIKNEIVIFFLIIGFISNILLDGANGIVFSLKGVATPILILFAFFAMRMLGAGDIKLFCAIGSILGLEFVLYNMAYSFICGGVIALLVLLKNKNGIYRLKYLLDYIKVCMFTGKMLPYTNLQNKSDNSKFHFTYAIISGTFVQLIMLL
jgi:prepilin peptidase CpaA